MGLKIKVRLNVYGGTASDDRWSHWEVGGRGDLTLFDSQGNPVSTIASGQWSSVFIGDPPIVDAPPAPVQPVPAFPQPF